MLLPLAMQSTAASVVRFRLSRPLTLLTFMQATTRDPHMSVTLSEYIWHKVHGTDSALLAKLSAQFSALGMDYSYDISDYPAGRPMPRSTMNLITIAAVQAHDVDEFMQRIAGILPNERWLQLGNIMNEAGPIYDHIMSRADRKAAQKHVKALSAYGHRVNDFFGSLRTFYGSTWTDDIPFTVAVYPVPGRSGNTTATPHSNSLVLAVLTKETDHDMRMGVTIHEMCHVLYGEQPLVLQQMLDNWFSNSKHPAAAYAYSYIDEALATACGNGWAYEQLHGSIDTGTWYNDEYINGYAHAIHPMVKRYIEAGRQIDSAFVAAAIAAFGATFPGAERSYSLLLNKVNIYTDADDNTQLHNIMNSVGRYFRISSSSTSYPIADPSATDMAAKAKGTQLFIVHKDNEANMSLLKKMFPQMASADANIEGISSFTDNKGRPVIVVNVRDASRLEQCMALMAQLKAIDPQKLFSPLQ